VIGKVETRSIMQSVAVPTLLVTSAPYLLTSPQARGWHLALLAHCTREEDGGRIVGAALWGAEQWLFVLGKGGSREAADAVVANALAEWAGDDLMVRGYAVELERAYRQSREAGQRGAERKRQQKLARLAGGEEPREKQGAGPPSSPPDKPPSSPPDREPVGRGEAKSGDVGQGDVSESTAGHRAAPRHEAPTSGHPTPATPPDIGSTSARKREAHRPESGPDPTAQLANCLRAKPGTAATDAERRALVGYCASLPPLKVQPALERLWDYWRAENSPTVTDWLARQHRVHR
jgi:hypothetical protein